MKLFTPAQKEAQKKVMKVVREGKYSYLKGKLWKNVRLRGPGYIKPLEDEHERCFMGVCYSALDIYEISELVETLGYPGTPGERNFPHISNYNDYEASSLNDVANWLVREHGWQDIK